MKKLCLALLSIPASACATLPIRQPPAPLPPPPPIANVAPVECTIPPEAPPVFFPQPLPPKASDGSDVIAVLRSERDRALAALNQAVSHADAIRVWGANKADRDERCAAWAAGVK